jgi:hypothetical protein
MIALDLSLENLYRQYLNCRKNKRNTVNALRFEAQQEKQLILLREALVERTYQPGRSVCFFTTRPKLREIFAADFRDRVVHHLLVDYLERIWEPIFIHDSYACRRGKGVHAGVKRLQTFIRQATANGTRPAWYLQLDIRNYFMSIDKAILLDLLAARLKDDTALWLTRLLVNHDCTSDYVMRGSPELLARIPPHKTLFGCGQGKGLPIGNLNSQFFANVYLNGLDQFVKHELKCRHYLRYCDDFVLLSRDAEQLNEWRPRIESYLRDALQLELNPRQRLAPVSNGVDFLGYIVRRDYLLVRRRVANHLQCRLRDYAARLVSEGKGMRRYRFDAAVLDQLAAMLSSYLGHFKLAHSWNLWTGIRRRFDFLLRYFDFDAENWRLVRKYTVPKGLSRVRNQYHYFRWRFPDDALLFQVGRFVEFYDIGRCQVAEFLGLKPLRQNRRGAKYGFPLEQAGRHLRSLQGAGQGLLLIAEAESHFGRIRQRMPVLRIEKCGAD